MKVLIEVEMGEKTCGPCLARITGEGYCRVFSVGLGIDEANRYERCPGCLSKYGTGDKPAPRDQYAFSDGGQHTVASVLLPNGREINLGRLAAMDAVVAAARVVARLSANGIGGGKSWYRALNSLGRKVDALDAEGGKG